MLGFRSRKLLIDCDSESPALDSDDDGNMEKLSSELCRSIGGGIGIALLGGSLLGVSRSRGAFGCARQLVICALRSLMSLVLNHVDGSSKVGRLRFATGFEGVCMAFGNPAEPPDTTEGGNDS